MNDAINNNSKEDKNKNYMTKKINAQIVGNSLSPPKIDLTGKIFGNLQ